MDTPATIAMYNNQPQRAADAAQKGTARAPSTSPVSVRLACQHTRALARLGHAWRFDEALSEAKLRLDQLPDPGAGLFSADAGRIASYAATSSVWLDRPEAAVGYARQALDFYASVPPADRSPTREAISRLDLGLALVAMKTPDEATGHVLGALDSDRVPTRSYAAPQRSISRFSGRTRRCPPDGMPTTGTWR